MLSSFKRRLVLFLSGLLLVAFGFGIGSAIVPSAAKN